MLKGTPNGLVANGSAPTVNCFERSWLFLKPSLNEMVQISWPIQNQTIG